MDNFSPEQYDRFEAYRRHALPKQAVRKVIQQTLGQQVSMPVAQIIAGFSKVFVGEMVEKGMSVSRVRCWFDNSCICYSSLVCSPYGASTSWRDWTALTRPSPRRVSDVSRRDRASGCCSPLAFQASLCPIDFPGLKLCGLLESNL